MKQLFLALLLLAAINLSAQMKQLAYTSTYQIDKTFNGNKVFSNHTAVISFTDPRLITNPDAGFENLPEGKLIIRYTHLSHPFIYVVKYYGHYAQNKNQYLYGITESRTDYNSLIVMPNDKTSEKSKGYKYILLTANMDPDNGNLITYTAYYCNIN